MKNNKINSPGKKGTLIPAGALNKKAMANIQQIIEVDGVVLTPSSVCLLKSLQGDDNSMIINLRDSLGDIISYFGSEIHVGNEQCETDAEFKRFISELSFLRQYLKDLKKP